LSLFATALNSGYSNGQNPKMHFKKWPKVTNISTDQGVFGNVLVNEDFLRTVGNPSVTAQGTMTSVYNLGCFGGALSTLYTGDKLGRPRTLMLGSITIAVGAIVQAACMNAAMQYAGRVIGETWPRHLVL
jgi:MFS family permease